MQAQVLLRGNSFARIVTGWDGQVRELWPLPVDTSVLRLPDGKLAYEYSDKAGKRVRLLSDEVLHLKHRVGDRPVKLLWGGGVDWKNEKLWTKFRSKVISHILSFCPESIPHKMTFFSSFKTPEVFGALRCSPRISTHF